MMITNYDSDKVLVVVNPVLPMNKSNTLVIALPAIPLNFAFAPAAFSPATLAK